MLLPKVPNKQSRFSLPLQITNVSMDLTSLKAERSLLESAIFTKMNRCLNYVWSFHLLLLQKRSQLTIAIFQLSQKWTFEMHFYQNESE